MMVARSFVLPLASNRDTPSVSHASAVFFVGPIKPLMMFLSEAPAVVDLTPALAIRPSATATSSTFIPREPASGATYLNDVPSNSTLVFEFVAAAARTSVKCSTYPVKTSAVPERRRSCCSSRRCPRWWSLGLVRPAGSLSRLDASNVLEKQRACSALDAVSLGTGCILQGLKSKKHEPFGSVICAHYMN